jgi:formate dehydrogenase assembly factor FdhD
MGRATERRTTVCLHAGAVSSRPDTLAAEEPLEIRLDAVRTTPRRPVRDTPPVRVDPGLLASLPDRLRAAQRVVDRTGGLAAAALLTDGEVLDPLAGFLRGHSMNVYAGEDRVTLAAVAAAQG